ncbi:MAG: SDR family NAD(P)-dependent oxidoreductase [Promethearchaeota archaeon]
MESIQYITMDVTDEESVRKALNSIDNVDILINNAGSGYFGPIEELTLEQTQYQFDVNFMGMLRVLQSVIPKMREKKSGRIINTSSLGGISCIPFQAHYSATKAAVLRMTESLRLELKPFNIHVSSLASGSINTFFEANTAMLHHKDREYKSTDIEDLIAAIPTPENSPYYNRAKIVWRSIIQNFLVSPPPIIVSRKIERIIKTRRPKVHYTVGNRIQTLGLNVMKRVFPETWTTRVMAMFYGL